ncbi:hypothetical protein [Lysinibacillus sp. FSL W8-0992]|uniref:hypothetical protein n=1 Tax=Lysinibacillus sp. FSL W8-0992 TaxID=2954643 RepID=UPI0030F6B438
MQKKFKLKDGLSITIHNLPDKVLFEGISDVGHAPYDRVISFVFTIDEMLTYLKSTLKQNMLAEQGYLFFVYPKKIIKNTKNIFTEMTFSQQFRWTRQNILRVAIINFQVLCLWMIRFPLYALNGMQREEERKKQQVVNV